MNRFESALTGQVSPIQANGPAQEANAPAKPVPAQQQAPAPAKQAPAPAQPKVPEVIADFEKHVLSKVKAMEDAAKDLGSEVVNSITAKFISALLTQRDVILTRLSCKAPADKALLLKHIQTAVGDVRGLKNKDAKFALHVQTVADGFGMFSWSAHPMLDEEWQEETINAINFYGFKVLQLKQDKDTAWQKAYVAIARAFVDFVVNNKDEVGEWKGASEAAEFWPN